MVYVGRVLLGYTDKEVGRLTYYKWKQQYDHYKDDYDFRLRQVSFEKAYELAQEDEEWHLPG